MRTRLILIVWLIGMLFPLAWLREFSPAYRSLFDSVFGPEWVHVIMHLFLFAGMSFLLGLVLRVPISIRSALRVLVLVLGIGIVQESLQAISQDIPVYRPAVFVQVVFDLGVDLTGGTIGLLCYAGWRSIQNRLASKSPRPQSNG